MLSPVFGTFVDRHRKKKAMKHTAVSVVSFIIATAVFVLVDATDCTVRSRGFGF